MAKNQTTDSKDIVQRERECMSWFALLTAEEKFSVQHMYKTVPDFGNVLVNLKSSLDKSQGELGDALKELSEYKQVMKETIKKFDEQTWKLKEMTIDRDTTKKELLEAYNDLHICRHKLKNLLLIHGVTNFELDRFYMKLYGDTNHYDKNAIPDSPSKHRRRKVQSESNSPAIKKPIV